MTDSQTLLAEYAGNGSESAFRELVACYLNLVYSTALRLVGGDTHLAEDVAQMVFVNLARRAPALPKDVLLGGWLHRDTCFVAGKTMRAQRRRQARERQAVEMNALQDHSQTNLARIAPILDEAINKLGAADRTAILLRFFENRDFRSVGQALGSSEDTAQKRVSRALDKLNSLLRHRGVALSATALVATLSTEAVAAVPEGLAATVSGTALASAATSGGLSLTFIKAMTMTKLKFGILGAVAAASLTVPVVIMKHSPAPVPAAENPASAQAQPPVNPNQPPAQTRADLTAGFAPRRPRSTPQTPLAVPAPDTNAFNAMLEVDKGRRLSSEQAQALESRLLQSPGDLSARCQLLGYYWNLQIGSKPAREAWRAQVFWFIQNHPELNLGPDAYLDPRLDGPVYDKAKALWLQQVNANPQNLAILANAAGFCLAGDRATAEDLFKRAQALDPANPVWPERLARIYAMNALSEKPGAPVPATAKALQEMEDAQAKTTDVLRRFRNLNSLAQMAFDAGDMTKAQAYAATLLQQTAEHRSDWSYGDAVYCGNLVLGRIALRQGDVEQAKQYLLASAQTTGSPVLGSFGPNMNLAKELLEQGEKESVLQYFRLCTNFWNDKRLATWTEQVNQGWIPDFGANLVH